MSAPLLEVRKLGVDFGTTPTVRDVSFTLDRGETLALVGESGSGKSVTALSIMQLLPHSTQTSGRILFDGTDILTRSEDEMCALRGDDIGMVVETFDGANVTVSFDNLKYTPPEN